MFGAPRSLRSPVICVELQENRVSRLLRKGTQEGRDVDPGRAFPRLFDGTKRHHREASRTISLTEFDCKVPLNGNGEYQIWFTPWGRSVEFCIRIETDWQVSEIRRRYETRSAAPTSAHGPAIFYRIRVRPSESAYLLSGTGTRLSFSDGTRGLGPPSGSPPARYLSGLAYYGAFSSLANYLHESLNLPVEQTGAGLFGGMVWFLAILGRCTGSARVPDFGVRIFSSLDLETAWISRCGALCAAPVARGFVLLLPALSICSRNQRCGNRASRENVRSIGYSIYTLVNISGQPAIHCILGAPALGVENVFRISALTFLRVHGALVL